jgi:hypothetical protein
MSDTDLTPEEWLAHYGVKGMKWGQRKAPTSAEIHDARARTASRERELSRQVDRTNLAKPGREQAREAKKLNELTLDYLKSPDRATALRMTKGEKVMNGIIAVGFPGVGTGAVAVAAGARVAIRKSVERDVEKARAGQYDGKKN